MSHRSITALALVVTGALAATTVSIPAAFAADDENQTQSGAAAQSPTQGTEDTQASSSDAQSAAPAPSDSADEAGEDSASTTPEPADDTPTTFIVQMEGTNAGVPWTQRAFGHSFSTKHQTVKDRVAASIEAEFPGASITHVRDYTNAFDGFAIEAPAAALEAIKGTEGVKTAFIERHHKPMVVDGDTGVAGVDAVNPELKNGSSLEMTRANQTPQKGDNQVIEVIDTGIESTHQAFSGSMDDVSVRLSQHDVEVLASQLSHGKTGAYINAKIPFVFDYADNDANVLPTSTKDLSHGTHVAAIATANGGEVRGTAPNAQLIVAKVVHDADGAMSDDALLAALDDALIIKPDVINISLGDDSGMSSEAGSIFADVYKALAHAGITVNAASGNAFSNAYGNNSGQNKPFASDPDTGTLGEPASYKSNLAVASVDSQDTLPYVRLGDHKIPYATAIDGNGEPVPSLRDIPEKTYRIVHASFGGSDEVQRYWGTNRYDLSDVIVLEDKGGIDTHGDIPMTDELKAENLLKATPPPAALMIADTEESGTPYQAITGAARDLPTVTITKASKDLLDEAVRDAKGGDIYVTVTHSGIVLASPNPAASEFSAWGVSPDLTLKPEVAAPGGNITSAILGGEYASLSGTSMASPQVAGISALVRQRIASDPAFASMSAADKNAVVTNLIMGTAHPLVDIELGDGTFYSPRKVGAGEVDAVAATTSSVYPSVVGSANPSRPKADLGDGTNGWTFQVRLTNVSDAAHTYTLGGQALSEDVQSMLFTGHSTNWAGAGIDLSFSADSVTVPAASSATVTVTVTPQAAFASYVSDKTPNGTFVDGAVTFTSADGQPNLTVPYMGFYGSWGQANVFDQQAPNNHMVGYGSTLMSGNLPFGQFNPYEMEDERALDGFHPDRFVITRNGSRTSVTPGTILLRAVPSLTYTVTNEAGATVRTYTCDRADKAFYDDHWRGMHNAEFMSPGCAPSFDSYDADGNELPDGRYTVTIEAATYGPSSSTQRTSYSFAVDTVSPVVSNVTVSGEGEERMLSFDVTDASPIGGYGFKTDPDGALTLWHVNSDPSSRSDDGLYHEHFDAKLPSVLSKLGGDPATIQLVVWDWVDNTATSSVSLKAEDTPAPAPTPKAGVWKWDGRGWWYRYEDGSYPADATLVIDGVTYRFDAAGYMRTGWVKDRGVWYYHNASGAQVSGWVLSGVSWYYLDPGTGAMATGWVQVGSTWYYLSPADGAMHTGWLQEGGHWYYLQSGSGAMATGWLRIWGTWYHFADNGQLIS